MLTNIRIALSLLRRDDKGATAIEYGLIAALVSIAIIGGLQLLGPSLDGLFRRVGAILGAA